MACCVVPTTSRARSVIGISSSRIAGGSSGRTCVIRRSSRRFNTTADQNTSGVLLEIEVVRHAGILIAERINEQLDAALGLGQRVHSQVDIEQIDIPGQLAIAQDIYV